MSNSNKTTKQLVEKIINLASVDFLCRLCDMTPEEIKISKLRDEDYLYDLVENSISQMPQENLDSFLMELGIKA